MNFECQTRLQKAAGALTGLFLTSTVLAFCSVVHAEEELPGGRATVRQQGPNAFSMPSGNMTLSRRLDFSVGNSFFRNPWVIAPSSTDARDGLGPLFNTNSCQSCHIKDGRGHPPEGPEDSALSMIVRLSVPATTPEERQIELTQGNLPDPLYGHQLQDAAIPGILAEGRVVFHWTESEVRLSDGEVVSLRRPLMALTDLNYGPTHQRIVLSPRVAPALIGLGLLEAIPESAILAREDVDDQNPDGISGKANRVRSLAENRNILGRFGWKAGQPSLMQQNAAAFHGDLGLTSHLFPQAPCTVSQTACLNAPDGGPFEVSESILSAIEFYTRNLAVPARRGAHLPIVRQGQQVFMDAGCATCHTPSFTTARFTDQPEQSEQTIWPYTDLLLHDMGDDLADGAAEYLAEGREWRTPPLWGLGYLQEVNGHIRLLHDGRARSIMEAILWHGGEAQAACDRIIRLNRSDRVALMAFLESL
jgi:CxxC motif-containing protein (DUF1111 family)